MRKIKFIKNYGVKLAKDFGDLKKGELFYVEKADYRLIQLVKQNDRSYSLKLPISVARDIFTNVSGLSNSYNYRLVMDFPYAPIRYAEYANWPKEFIQKHSQNDWIVFKKGLEVKYVGPTQGGDLFIIDGVSMEINNVDNIDGIEDVSDLFAGIKN